MVENDFLEGYEEDEKAMRGAILTEPISSLDLRRHVSVPHDASVAEAVLQMTETHTGCVCVVEGGILVGIFTERDLLRIVQGKIDTATTPVGQVMTEKPVTLRPRHGIAQALNQMSEGGFRHIPLVDGLGRPVGIVAMRDIVSFIVSLFPDAVLNVPPDPEAIQTEYGG
ncbi:MAG: CBS domain-containing protein [Proteobacteria bacterium]|nr:CBS domain-containing protein [Pseudomonadota bacterium]